MLSGGLSRRGKVRLRVLTFNSQFLYLIKADRVDFEFSDLLIKRQRNPYLQSLLQNVRDRVKAGELLSDAFSGWAFLKIYTSTLMAGEKSGNMEEVLTAASPGDGADFRQRNPASRWLTRLCWSPWSRSCWCSW